MSMFSVSRAARSRSVTWNAAPSRALAPPATRPVQAASSMRAVRDEVERRPLIGEDERVADGERRHAADAEAQARRDRGEGAQQGQRVGPRLGAEAVADPHGSKERARIGPGGQAEHLRHAGDAEEDTPGKVKP